MKLGPTFDHVLCSHKHIIRTLGAVMYDLATARWEESGGRGEQRKRWYSTGEGRWPSLPIRRLGKLAGLHGDERREAGSHRSREDVHALRERAFGKRDDVIVRWDVKLATSAGSPPFSISRRNGWVPVSKVVRGKSQCFTGMCTLVGKIILPPLISYTEYGNTPLSRACDRLTRSPHHLSGPP